MTLSRRRIRNEVFTQTSDKNPFTTQTWKGLEEGVKEVNVEALRVIRKDVPESVH